MAGALTNLDPNYFRTDLQGTYKVNGVDVSGDWQIVYSTMDELIVTTTDDTLPSNGLKLETDKNLLIYADHLSIWREIVIPGRAIKIVANVIGAAPVVAPATTADILISTSPPPVDQTILALPAAYGYNPASVTATKYFDGIRGADATYGQGAAAIQNGKVVDALLQERLGLPAGPIDVGCTTLDASVGTLSLISKGGQGGPGISGQGGSSGGDGIVGEQHRIITPNFTRRTYGPWNTTSPLLGGGNGGDAGAGVLGFPGGSGAGCSFGIVRPGTGKVVTDPSVGDTGVSPAKASGGAGGAAASGYNQYTDPDFGSPHFEGNTGTPVMPAGSPGADGAMIQPVAPTAPTGGVASITQIKPQGLSFDSAFWLKMLQKAKNLYFYCYPVPDDDQGQNDEQIKWLKERLGWMSASIPDTVPASPNAEDLRIAELRHRTEALLYYLQMGRTVFGSLPNAVPSLGLDDLLKTLTASESTFGNVQTSFQNTIAAVAQGQANAIKTAAVLTSLQGRKSDLEGKIKASNDVISSAAERLDGIAKSLDMARNALLNADATLQHQVQSYFGCSLKDILSAAQTFAFAPNEGMAAVAGAQLLYSSVTTIDGEDGVPINKNYLIKKAVDLSSDIKKSATDAFNAAGRDLSNTALVTKLDDFEAWLAKLPTSIPAAAGVSDDIEDFKRQLRMRSATALEYNTAVNDWRAYATEHKNLMTRINHVQNNQAQMSDPTLAVLSSYLAAVYQGLQDDAMALLYQACQAFHYKYLQAPQSAFGDYQEKLLWAQGGQPSFTFTDLETAVTKLQTDGASIESKNGWNPVHFGPPTHASVTLSLKNPEILTGLKQNKSVDFTTVPARPSGKTEFVPLNTSNFADIRLTHIRPRIIGAKTKGGSLAIAVRHGGIEKLVTLDGDLLEFTHEPVKITMTLDLSVPANQPYPWAAKEGDLAGGRYLSLGLFTDWTIEITEPDAVDPTNTGLDLSQVTSVEIEFCGTYRPMS